MEESLQEKKRVSYIQQGQRPGASWYNRDQRFMAAWGSSQKSLSGEVMGDQKEALEMLVQGAVSFCKATFRIQ